MQGLANVQDCSKRKVLDFVYRSIPHLPDQFEP